MLVPKALTASILKTLGAILEFGIASGCKVNRGESKLLL